jgi:phage-related protein
VFGLASKYAFSQVEAANTAGTKLHGGLGVLQTDLAGATKAYDAWGKAASPGVARVLGQALGLIPEALKAAQPFLAPTEKALSGIIAEIGKGMNSGAFKSWTGAFSSASGADLSHIGKSLINVAEGVGGVLKAFLPMSETMTGGLEKLTKRFAVWGDTLSSHSGFKSLESMATQDGPLLISVFKNIGGTIKNLGSDMAGLSTFSNSHLLLMFLNPLTGILKLLSSNPKLMDLALWGYAAYGGLSKATTGFKALKGGLDLLKNQDAMLGKLAAKIGLVTVAQEGEEAAQVSLNMAFLANPFVVVIALLVGLGVTIYELSKHSKAFRDFWIDAWHDITHVAEVAFNWVKGHWPLIGAILLGPVAVAAYEIYKHWHDIAHGAEVMWNAIAGFFRRLPGILLGYVKDFGHLLFDAGSNIIHGLIGGVEAEAGKLWSYIGGIGSKISGVFKGALSILSPSRVFFSHGMNIVLGLVAGIDGYAHLAESSVKNLAQRAIGASGGRFYGSPTGSNGAALTIEWIGGGGADQEFISWLKRCIRIRGGNPAVLGR